MSEEKKSGCGGIIWILIIIIGGFILFNNFLNPPPNETQKQQMEPDSAMMLYLKTAYKFTQDPQQNGGTPEALSKCVLDEDWEWFENNYKKLDVDLFDLKSGINPSDADYLARIKVLNRLVESGPHRDDSKIVNSTVIGDKATLTVNEFVHTGDGEGYRTDYEVVLIKKGKYWKVKDFAGGRQKISRSW